MAVYYWGAAFLCLGGFLWNKEDETLTTKKTKAQTIFWALAAAYFILTATLRYGIGFDYFNYQDLYEELGVLPIGKLASDHVAKKFISYSVLMRVCHLLHFSYPALLLGINLFLTAGVFWFIKKESPLPWLSAYLYLTLQFFAHSMNLIRQSIAATICLFAYSFLKKRKFVPFCLMVVLASTFHLSALFFLPFYWILNWKVNVKRFVFFTLALVPIYLYSTQVAQFLTQYLFRSYAGYIGSRYWTGLGISYAIFPTIYWGSVLLCKDRLLKKDGDNRFFINSAFYVFLLYWFGTKHMILERFSIYLFFPAIVLLPKLAETFLEQKEKGRKEKMRAYLVLATILLLSFAYLIFASKQGTNGFHKVYPYRSILTK